jgi:hypothetical protein
MTTPFSAGPQALGYLFQARRALYVILNAPEGGEIVIEGLDDIALTHPGGRLELEQLKHHITSVADLTDSSSDLWKTIRAWSSALASGVIDGASTTLTLLTTGTAAANSIASMLAHDGPDRDESTALERLRNVAATSKNKSLEPSFQSFCALAPAQQEELVSAIRILDSATDILGLDAKIRERILFSAPPQFLSAVQQRLEGWWFSEVAEQLVNGSTIPIPQLRVHDMVVEIAAQYRDDSLPITFLDKLPQTVDPQGDDRLFVRQLREITSSNERIELAIVDYYRAFEQRAHWVRHDLLVDSDLESFENKLCDELRRHRLALEDELGLDRSDPTACKTFGLKLYSWAQTENFPIRPRVFEPYVTRGSFHILADCHEPELRVWWHPLFLDRLKALAGTDL